MNVIAALWQRHELSSKLMTQSNAHIQIGTGSLDKELGDFCIT